MKRLKNILNKKAQAFAVWYNYTFKVMYLVNAGTGEIHVIKHIRKACHTERMSRKNAQYMSEKQLNNYQKKHPSTDGCRFCNFQNHH